MQSYKSLFYTVPDKGGPVDDGLTGGVQSGKEVVQLFLRDDLMPEGQGAQAQRGVAVNLPLRARQVATRTDTQHGTLRS